MNCWFVLGIIGNNLATFMVHRKQKVSIELIEKFNDAQ